MSLLEDTILVKEQRSAAMLSHDQAREYVERFNDLRSRAGTTPGSLDVYEEPFPLK